MWMSQVETFKIGKSHVLTKKKILSRLLLGKVSTPNHITAFIDKTK